MSTFGIDDSHDIGMHTRPPACNQASQLRSPCSDANVKAKNYTKPGRINGTKVAEGYG